MKQIVEQVMAAMKNGTPASAPAAASGCGPKVTAANYPLAESMADQIKTPTGKDFTSLSYEKVINGELSADDMRIAPETLEMQAQVAESVHREAFARQPAPRSRAHRRARRPPAGRSTMPCVPTAPPSRSCWTSPASWTASTAPRPPLPWCGRLPRFMRSAAA